MSGQLSTSWAAWERVQRSIKMAQSLALTAITEEYPDGLTDDALRHELIDAAGGASKSGPATRRGELVKLGLVRILRDENGLPVKRDSDAGMPMMVWQAVPPEEYVEPAAEPTERQPNATGLAAARARAEWEIGEASWADLILRAYLNPTLDAAELEAERND